MNIFYGAGIYAEKHLEEWKAAGKVPDFFADGDSSKWGKMLCGIPIISPEEMMNKISTEYDNIYIYISVRPGLYNKIHKHLTEDLKIPKEIIVFADEVYYGYGCTYIGHFISINENRFKCCCNDAPIIHIPSHQNNLEALDNFTKSIATALELFQHKPLDICLNCSSLKIGYFEKTPQIESVSIADLDNRCNLKCIYCIASKAFEKTGRKYDLLDYARVLSQRKSTNTLTIFYCSGEFSINPQKNDFIDIVKNQNWHLCVLTNAVIYVNKLEEISNKCNLQVSMDSGTRETFKIVKQADVWNKVCDNLIRYSQNGIQVDLKYIFLPDINDNRDDIEGFLALAQKTGNSKIVISRDMRNREVMLPDKTIDGIKYMIEEAKRLNLSWGFVIDKWNSSDAQRLSEYLI
jgi:pyruvate-formate lyase-activating enzyme